MAKPRKKVKRKRSVPRSLAQKDDREIMERIFGKRTMRKVDEVAKPWNKDDSNVMQED